MKVTRQFDLFLKIGIGILTLLSVAMIYLYMQVDRALDSTRAEMIDMIVDRYGKELRNAAAYVSDETGSPFLERIDANRTLRLSLEKVLYYFKTDEIESVFVIYRDARGRYRYLLDAEKRLDQKAMYRQRFEPVSDIWEKAYASGTQQIHRHLKNGRLWISVAVPILEKGRTVAVLGSDLSASIRSDVQRRFSQIKSILFAVAVIIGLLLIFGYIQIYYYFRGRSRSFVDPLTGAYNRKFLYEVLANGDYTAYQVIMYDVDHFKKINDSYGHDVGDEVLKMLTRRIMRMLREEDIVVRFGGEEFIIFLKTNNPEEVVEVAERIKKAIETTPFLVDSKMLRITISMGINNEVVRSSNIDEAIETADEQLYCAKNAGRNRVCIRGEVVS